MEKKYIYSDLFAFPRCNVIEGDKFILNKPLFPDLQTRLTKAEKAGGRKEIHAGSPFGTGTVIPCAIMHDKFIVRSYEERKSIAENYESVKTGCGLGEHYRAFSLWEDFYKEPKTRSIYGINGLHSGQINDWQKYS